MCYKNVFLIKKDYYILFIDNMLDFIHYQFNILKY